MLNAKEEAEEAAQAVKELVKELRLAVDLDAAARIRESEAANHATTCLNRLNAAQKKMDAWYAEQRKAAPYNSDWSRSKRTEEGRQ